MPSIKQSSFREPDGESQGVWYTAGTVDAYGRQRSDASVPPDVYACVHSGNHTVYSGAMATYCAWHRPMAIYAAQVDTTFFVFGNPKNYPTISAYDHQTGHVAAPVVLGTNPNLDAHRNPTILLDTDGVIHVFYGAHGHPTRVVRSTRPFDITAWEAAACIPEKNTYPQPWQLQPEKLFVSYRAAPGWCCRRSVDSARSWQDSVNLVHFRGASIYAVSVAETGTFPRRIHLAWEKMGGGTAEEVRTKALWARRYNVYYAYSDDGGTTWRRSDGSVYELPITENKAELLHDSGEHGVWLKDIQLDPDGNPCILFLDADVRTYETTWKFARLAAGGWHTVEVTRSDHMYDAGGIVVFGQNDFRIYGPSTAAQQYEDGGEIEEWTSNDSGVTWQNTTHITHASQYSHNHVKVVWNHQKSDFRFLWSYGDSEYPPATRNVYLFRYGEALDGPQQMRFPASCIQPPQFTHAGD